MKKEVNNIDKISTYEELVAYINLHVSDDGAFVNPEEFTMTEVNVWTYWQGMDNRKPCIRLLGQDWGTIKNKTNRKYLAGIKKMLNCQNRDPDKVYYFDETKGKMNFATDRNICTLFESFGYKDIGQKRNENLFFTNLIPGLRAEGGSSGGLKKDLISADVKAEFKKLVEILQPKIIICLGRIVYESVLEIYEKDRPKNSTWNADLDDFYKLSESAKIEPISIVNDTYVFPVAHPGAYGTRVRSIDKQMKDWKKIAAWMNTGIR